MKKSEPDIQTHIDSSTRKTNNSLERETASFTTDMQTDRQFHLTDRQMAL